MDAAAGRCRISECLPSSTAANSSIYFCSSCQNGSNAGFFGRPLSFLTSYSKSVSFDSRIKLTRRLSTSSSVSMRSSWRLSLFSCILHTWVKFPKKFFFWWTQTPIEKFSCKFSYHNLRL